jgi:hypothetical protein
LVCLLRCNKIALATALILSFLFACGLPPSEKSLEPRQLFTTGSSFLDNANSIALKGQISFEGGKIDQSGSFQLFISGPDSLSFIVEGPFGTDIFRMIIANDTAYLLSNKEDGWQMLDRDEDISIPEFGIENISPFLLGLFAFPQHYLNSSSGDTLTDEFSFRGQKIISQFGRNNREFLLIDPHSLVAGAYTKRKNFNDGFIPSLVRIFEPGHDWQITLQIDKIRLNPVLPENIWKRE